MRPPTAAFRRFRLLKGHSCPVLQTRPRRNRALVDPPIRGAAGQFQPALHIRDGHVVIVSAPPHRRIPLLQSRGQIIESQLHVIESRRLDPFTAHTTTIPTRITPITDPAASFMENHQSQMENSPATDGSPPLHIWRQPLIRRVEASPACTGRTGNCER